VTFLLLVTFDLDRPTRGRFRRYEHRWSCLPPRPRPSAGRTARLHPDGRMTRRMCGPSVAP
jgi:hypothetical protein